MRAARKTRMKVLFLGPATTHLLNWLNAFADSGVEVVLLTLHRDRYFDPSFRCIDLSGDVRGKLSYFRALPAIRAAVALEQPDLLVSYYASSYGLLGRLTAFRPHVVVTAGSDINLSSIRQLHLKALVRIAFSGAACVVCWSNTMKERIQRLGVRESRIFVLPRGISLEAIPPRKPGNGPLSIICTRRFSRIFHHDALIGACRGLHERGIPFSLRLCGTGPEEPRIRQLVEKAGLARQVNFLGQLPYSTVLDELSAADVAISLSSKDGASASLFEALGAGCYPVVTRIPANEAWLTDGVNGRFVAVGDVRGLTDVLEFLAVNRSEIARVGAVNREYARLALDLKANTRRYCELFESLITVSRSDVA